MKKIILTGIVMVAFATNMFAVDPLNYKAIYKLNNETTFNELVRYLNADETQADDLKYLFELTENKLRAALKTNDETVIKKALFFNMGNAKNILSDKQYKKYLAVLNLSVNTDNVEFLTQK